MSELPRDAAAEVRRLLRVLFLRLGSLSAGPGRPRAGLSRARVAATTRQWTSSVWIPGAAMRKTAMPGPKVATSVRQLVPGPKSTILSVPPGLRLATRRRSGLDLASLRHPENHR